jgi:hypothetical protein
MAGNYTGQGWRYRAAANMSVRDVSRHRPAVCKDGHRPVLIIILRRFFCGLQAAAAKT